MRRLVVESWAGKTPREIAITLSCHPRTVRIHLNRFNAQGINGLGMREGAGRRPRLTELERSRILALVKQSPPGKLERYAQTLEARDAHRSGAVEPGCPRPLPLTLQVSRENGAR